MFGVKSRMFGVVFPDTCIVCGKPVTSKEYACPKCMPKIPYITPQFKCRTCLGLLHNAENGMCGTCLLASPAYSQLISCVKYQGEVQKTIRAYKFYNRPDYHLGYSKLACEVLEKSSVCFDAVLPIPLYKKTYDKRGYNQSALIAEKISEYFGVPYFDDLLIKTKETKRQSELKLADRSKNIKGAFKTLNPERLSGLVVLLVDDIFTSGSTMREASKMVAPFCDDVIAFTLARTQFKY